MTKRAFVLLSGGADSTVCLHKAVDQWGAPNVMALLAHYGQRHGKEARYAIKSCDRLGVDYTTIHLGMVMPRTMLTDPKIAIPDVAYSDMVGVSPTFAPFRNGLLLSAAAALAYDHAQRAQAHDIIAPERLIYFGAHAEDAAQWAYPDCTAEFMGAMANAIFIGTYQHARLLVPFQYMTKAQIIREGETLGVNWSDTWSCYKGLDEHCGTCPTCRARKEAFRTAGVTDPTIYLDDNTQAQGSN